MFLTTSKHASKELQVLARRLASHLPECHYLPRSERPLERVQTIAFRAGEHTLLVLSSPQNSRPPQEKNKSPHARPRAAPKKFPAAPPALISSRSRAPGDSWAWHAQTLALFKIKFHSPMPRLTAQDDPLEIKIAPTPAARALAAFLGMGAGPRSPLFADSTPVTFKAIAKKAEMKLSRTPLIQFEYSWC